MSRDARTHPWSFVLDENARILFVDDDPILTEFAKVNLSTPVAAVEAAPNGLAAWEWLCAEPFDLALIDIEMPVLDGFGLLGRIRGDTRLRYLPVVMVTGHEDIVSIDRSYQLGATSFVTKPINWRQLSYQLRHVLRTSRMEASVRAARDRAEENSSLKSNMLSIIRHELRPPLDSIIALSDLIRQRPLGLTAIANQAEYADHIHAAGHRLLAFLADIVHYELLTSIEFQLVDNEHPVHRIVDGAVAGLRQMRAAVFSVDVHNTEHDLRLVCDREQLERALRHLLCEAAAYDNLAPVGFSVERSANGELVFSIADHGSTMALDQLAAAAQSADQADVSLLRAKRGPALGLALARRITELHGGALTIEARQGQGTRVTMTLPSWRVIRSPGSSMTLPSDSPTVVAGSKAV